MSKSLICLAILTVLTLLPFVSPYTYLNIYVDENGDASFLGETNENLSLPSKINGATSILTSKSLNTWNFFYSLSEAEIKVFLPKGAKIINVEGDVFIERGKIVIYSIGDSKIDYTIEPTEANYFLIFLIILIVLTALIALYLIYKYIKSNIKNKTTKDDATKKQKSKLEIIKKVLSEREKLILDNLKKSGKIKMSYLRKLTNIPKASFSRHIQELEKKQLIKRLGEGKNKFIELR